MKKRYFYAICREEIKGDGCFDVVMDWNSEQLFIFDDYKKAIDALKQYKKYYPNDGARMFKKVNPFYEIKI